MSALEGQCKVLAVKRRISCFRLLENRKQDIVARKYRAIFAKRTKKIQLFINPLRPNSDPSQTSHCNIKGVLASEVMRIENMITQVQFC